MGNALHTVECYLDAYNIDDDCCHYIGSLFYNEFNDYDEAHRAYMTLNAETITLRSFMAARHPDMNVYVVYSIDDNEEMYPLT